MPHSFSMLDTQFPHFSGDESTDAKIEGVQDYLFMLLEQLKYMLYNLDSGNFNDAALQELRDSLKEGIETNVVISNTVITENLYAEYGDIAELTVDRLLSANKVEKYRLGDTSDINYIWIEGQSIKLMTGTATGGTTQHIDRHGRPLYWYDGNMLGMSTKATAFPVIVFDYKELVKAQFSFDLVDETYVPRITLGAGSGTGDRDKLFIQKLEDIAKFTYVTDTGAETFLNMTDFVDAKMRRIENVAIDKSSGTVSVLLEGRSSPEMLSYSESADSMTFIWPDGHTARISIG
jgi:hypothetical protein